VGRAVHAVREGRTVAVLGLEPGEDPAIDLGATPGVLHAGGIAQFVSPGAIEYAFVTTLDVDAVERLVRARGVDPDVRAHRDHVTATTLVIHRAAAHPSRSALPVLLDRVQRTLAACAVEELDAELGRGTAAARREPERQPDHERP
jgi:hypothetical protein